MNVQQQIVICIGTDRSNGVRARLSLLIVNADTGSILSEHYHSMMLMPGDDPAAARAAITAHLAMPEAQSGIPGAPWPAIPDVEWAKVTAVCSAIQTPAAVAAHKAQQAVAAAGLKPAA